MTGELEQFRFEINRRKDKPKSLVFPARARTRSEKAISQQGAARTAEIDVRGKLERHAGAVEARNATKTWETTKGF